MMTVADDHIGGVVTPAAVNMSMNEMHASMPLPRVHGHHHHHHHGAPHHAPHHSAQSAAAAPQDAPAAAALGPLFEDLVYVHTKNRDREEVCQPLGIAVSVQAHAAGTGRAVTIRLTDPRDPYFLYAMSLHEDDYGRFKDKHELNVDFNGFPRFLVAMLDGALCHHAAPADADSHDGHAKPPNHHLHFVIADGASGVLRVMEKTDFRSLEHLSLVLLKQGDVGQKQYLAERFKYYEASYEQVARERADEAERAGKALAAAQRELAQTARERDALAQKLQLEASEAAAEKTADLSTLKDAHMGEVRGLHVEHDRERTTLTGKLEAALERHATESAAAGAAAADATQRIATLERAETHLTARLREETALAAARQTEIAAIREENAALSAARVEAMKQQTQGDLYKAQTDERLRHLAAACATKDEEVAMLRQQHESQAQFGTLLQQQLEAAQKKAEALEASLAKAHHIITNQMQQHKAGKEQARALQAQNASLAALVAEKTLAADRSKAELRASGDRVELLQQKVADLKEQLAASEQHKEKLAGSLKQNEDALIHMQRMASGVGARSTWASSHHGGASAHQSTLHNASSVSGIGAGSAGGGTPGPSVFSYPAGLYKDFARGATATRFTPAAAGTPPQTTAGEQAAEKTSPAAVRAGAAPSTAYQQYYKPGVPSPAASPAAHSASAPVAAVRPAMAAAPALPSSYFPAATS
jgi:spindle assembly abnormal protein 6